MADIPITDGMLYADTIGDIWCVRGKWRFMVWDGECWDETAGAFKRGTGGPASRQEQPRVVLAAATPPATMRRAQALVMQAAGPRPADGIGPLTVGRNSPNWPAFDAITAKLAEVLRG